MVHREKSVLMDCVLSDILGWLNLCRDGIPASPFDRRLLRHSRGVTTLLSEQRLRGRLEESDVRGKKNNNLVDVVYVTGTPAFRLPATAM